MAEMTSHLTNWKYVNLCKQSQSYSKSKPQKDNASIEKAGLHITTISSRIYKFGKPCLGICFNIIAPRTYLNLEPVRLPRS